MNRLTRQQDLAIVSAWLLGHTRNKIARDLGISGSTVSAAVGCLPSILHELRELNKNFRKLNVPALTLNLTVKEILQHAGEDFKVEEMPQLVAHALKAAEDVNHKVTDVIAADHRLSKLEAKAGKPYLEAMKEYETKVDASEKLNEENAKQQEINKKLEQKAFELKQQNTEARREKKKLLTTMHATEKTIISFKNAERNLSEFGYNIEDAKKLAKHISFVKKSKCKPEEFGLMVAENRSINEAADTAKKNLQKIQVKVQAAKKDEEQNRWTADREWDRLEQNKNAAEFWRKRANYLKQTARGLQDYLNRTSLAAHQQKLYHDIIIEENIKNEKMSPETAAEHRLLKEIDLVNHTFDEYTKAFVSITERKIEDFLFECNPQENSEGIHVSVEWVDKKRLKEGC